MSRAFFRTLSIEEYLKSNSTGFKHDMLDMISEKVNKLWQDGICLALFAEPDGRIIYEMELTRPVNLHCKLTNKFFEILFSSKF